MCGQRWSPRAGSAYPSVMPLLAAPSGTGPNDGAVDAQALEGFATSFSVQDEVFLAEAFRPLMASETPKWTAILVWNASCPPWASPPSSGKPGSSPTVQVVVAKQLGTGRRARPCAAWIGIPNVVSCWCRTKASLLRRPRSEGREAPSAWSGCPWTRSRVTAWSVVIVDATGSCSTSTASARWPWSVAVMATGLHNVLEPASAGLPIVTRP